VSFAFRNKQYIIEKAADLLVSPKALLALIEVEAQGEGLMGGRPIIRLEVNKFWSRCDRAARKKVDERFVVEGPKPWQGHKWLDETGVQLVPLHQPGPKGQELEWRAFSCATQIDPKAAFEATSWGAGQVMGWHWSVLGYGSPLEMRQAMDSEQGQIDAMCRYLELENVDEPLRKLDWEEVARMYNGDGQVQWYADRLEKAYAAQR
jgi:hypothetical protein